MRKKVSVVGVVIGVYIFSFPVFASQVNSDAILNSDEQHFNVNQPGKMSYQIKDEKFGDTAGVES